ncbi:MAG: ABC transporter substrate-binding protein, partial [Clostridia bacterium]|nr:ABC transporter substrate-binding protein [Clostridia bacterium]
KVIASQFPDSDEVLLTTVVERYRSIGAWKTEPTMTEAAYESLLTIIRAAGVIDEAPEFSSIVDNRFAQAVK